MTHLLDRVAAVALVDAATIVRGRRRSRYVNTSLERDPLPRSTAAESWTGNASSWRNTPQSTVILQVLGAVLLVCLGLLLGSSWTIQASQPKLGRQAEERLRLNEEWAALRTAHPRRGRCPRCASPLSDRDW